MLVPHNLMSYYHAPGSMPSLESDYDPSSSVDRNFSYGSLAGMCRVELAERTGVPLMIMLGTMGRHMTMHSCPKRNSTGRLFGDPETKFS